MYEAAVHPTRRLSPVRKTRPPRAQAPRPYGYQTQPTAYGPRPTPLDSALVRGELRAHILHVELLNLLDQRLQRGLGERAGLCEHDHAIADRHDRRDGPNVELGG